MSPKPFWSVRGWAGDGSHSCLCLTSSRGLAFCRRFLLQTKHYDIAFSVDFAHSLKPRTSGVGESKADDSLHGDQPLDPSNFSAPEVHQPFARFKSHVQTIQGSFTAPGPGTELLYRLAVSVARGLLHSKLGIAFG